MPYIDDRERKKLTPLIEALANEIVNISETVDGYYGGRINFTIHKLIQQIHKTLCERENCTLTYSDYNEVIGALEAAKLEYYRKVVVPYEEKKIKENGDL